MDRRLSLHKEFEALLGNKNCYYQPPESVKLKFDCIIYNLSTANIDRADNGVYLFTRRYNVTFITKNPDNPIIEELPKRFEHCVLNNFFTSDNLNHYNYTLFY